MKAYATIHSFYGAFVVSTGGTLFPRLFSSRKEAEEVCREINKTHHGEDKFNMK